MKMAIKSIISLGLAFALMFAFVPASFAKTFPSQSVEDLTKPWEINFSQPVDPAYATSEYVYILDGTKKHNTSVKLLNGGKTIEITPSAAYVVGKSYTLEVADTIKSITGKAITDKASKRFDVIDKASAIQSIQYTYAQKFSNFIVTTRSDVHNVKISGQDMEPIGFNEYSRAFYDLKEGSTVTIRAYSSTNKVLETKSFLID